MHDLKMKIICTYPRDLKFKTEFRVNAIGLYDPVVHVVIEYLTFFVFYHYLTQKQKQKKPRTKLDHNINTPIRNPLGHEKLIENDGKMVRINCIN